MDAINKYFQSYNAVTAQKALSDKEPPTPIYTAPINITAIVKASALDAILYGLPIAGPLAVIYSIAAFCIRKISGRVIPPPLPKYSWQVLLALAPVFAYRLVQLVVGTRVHPAAIPGAKYKLTTNSLENIRQRVPKGYQAMIISTLSATRHLVDGVLFKKKEEDLKGRWMIVTPPNAMFYEQLMNPEERIIALAERLNANILFFNYAGAGRSSGLFPNRDAMVASHQAMLSLLEEIGATEIVDFGWSIGGGVKWRDHLENPRPKGKYYIVDYQTFRSTSNFGREKLGKIGAQLGEIGAQAVKFLEWEYDSERALEASPHPYTVVQAGKNGGIIDDGVIKKDNALSQAAREGSVVLSPGGHGQPLSPAAIDRIAEKVDAFFKGE